MFEISKKLLVIFINITGALCVENKIKQHWLFFFGKGRLNLLEGGKEISTKTF